MKKIFTLFMLCAVCALGAAAQELLPLVGNWRFTTAGTASSDGNVYSGDVTLTGQWGDMGGAAWAGEVGTGGKHTITIKVSEPLPEGFQWKVNYVDATDDNAQYVPFDAGQTEVSFVFDKTYTFEVKDAEGNVILRSQYGVYSYVNAAFEKAADNEALMNLAKALFVYGNAAKTYFGQ